LARRFDRGASWVSRRLALVELLPEAIQQPVREGALRAELAMKYLVPGPEGAPRVGVEDCQRMAAAFVQHRCDTRQAGQLYAAWREGSRVVRERILTEPELFLKTQRQPPPSPATTQAAGLQRDLEMAAAILHRASRRLAEASAEMNSEQLEQARRQIDGARRELGRMVERIGKEQGAQHAEPGTTNRDSGTERKGSDQTRDCTCVAVVAPDPSRSHPGDER